MSEKGGNASVVVEQKSADRAKDFKGSTRKIFEFLAQYKKSFVMVIILAISSTLFSLMGPKMLGNVTDEIYKGIISMLHGGPGVDIHKISKILLLLVILYSISAFLSWVVSYVMSGISQRTCYELRKKMMDKLDRFPMSYFENQSKGEILSRFSNDVDIIGQSLNNIMSQFITAITMLIGIIVVMLTISPVMTIISLLLMPISVIVTSVIVKISQKYFVMHQEFLGHINSKTEESFSGFETIQLYNKQEKVVDTFMKDNKVLYMTAWKSQFLSGLVMPFMNFVSNLGYVAVAIVGSMLVVNGSIGIGEIQSFTQYMKNFAQQILQVSQVLYLFQATAAASERIFEFLEETEKEENPKDAVDIKKITQGVQFVQVQFGYEKDKEVIQNLSLNIHKNDKVAIVGKTGAGKSTLIKLLLRFYQLNGGTIRIDETDIKQIRDESLYQLFGVVMQDCWFFKGSIMENIRYGSENATDEEVIQAAKAAYAHHFISTFPEGYNMIINEEASNLSQGQKQLLAIARTILGNKNALILDEATSSVDTRTEALIQEALDNMTIGRTSFIIAHRLSTIRNADLILVMKDGKIVEIGKHEELLKSKGYYLKLYNN